MCTGAPPGGAFRPFGSSWAWGGGVGLPAAPGEWGLWETCPPSPVVLLSPEDLSRRCFSGTGHTHDVDTYGIALEYFLQRLEGRVCCRLISCPSQRPQRRGIRDERSQWRPRWPANSLHPLEQVA